ncbi:hypothetical protein [Moorella sulfitireducens (nom. illeg.)]|uniref:hypothetical protein n=1 Tax=Neomoorella sulfitireducens TaxID=2972948 RepID=UPI0021AC559A|nr:hypothetical protein [Moorella sulfitireducens]
MWFIFWLVGLLTGIAAVNVYKYIRAGCVQFKWFHWLLGIIWYLSGMFVIGFVTTSFAEGQPQAAGMATLIFGGIFLIVSVLLYRFVYPKRLNTNHAKEEATA